jgi:hypothetical protein
VIQILKILWLIAENGMLVDDVYEIILVDKIIVVNMVNDYTFGDSKKT